MTRFEKYQKLSKEEFIRTFFCSADEEVAPCSEKYCDAYKQCIKAKIDSEESEKYCFKASMKYIDEEVGED